MTKPNIFKQPYKDVRNRIKTGDLLSWRSATLLGAGIRLFTKGYVNHSSICTDIKVYGHGRKFCLEAMDFGIELNCISRRLEEFKGSVFWHPLRPELESYRDVLGEAAFSRLGVGYDYTSIFKQMFGRVSLSAKKLFCSEFVYMDFVDAKVPGAHSDAVAPNPHELFSKHQFWGLPIQIK